MKMSLNKKLVLLLALTGIILLLLFHVASRAILRPSQEDQKRIFVESLKKRIRMAFSFEEKSIGILSANWSDWESMAHFVASPSREFTEDVFPDMIFFEDMMDLVVVTGKNEQILFSKAYQGGRFYAMDRLVDAGDIHELTRRVTPKYDTETGIINSQRGPVMVVASPVVTGQTLKSVGGMLILGRFVDSEMMEKITPYLMEDVKILPLKAGQIRLFRDQTMKGEDLHYTENKDRLTVYYLVRDLGGDPAMVLHIETDNRMFKVITQHVITFNISVVTATILLGLMLYLGIRSHIIRRVLYISDSMKRIEGLEDLSTRIKTRGELGDDEIFYLVTTINAMLDKLEQEKNQREVAEKAMITHGKLASIGRLASSIGHEINNPLLAISNSIQVIKKISRSRSQLFKEAMEITESELNRIRDIISSLLDFHRLKEERFYRIEVGDVVRKSLNVLKWSKKLRGTHFDLDIKEDCYVHGSPVKLKQVFINFIVNAVEAMEMKKEPGENRLHIRVNCADCEEAGENSIVEIHFYDNGPGIPEKIRSYLFEPFVTTKTAKGVGLGLYISYKIIENHQGAILYDESFKDGTHFLVRLPQKPPKKRKKRKSRKPGRKKKEISQSE